MTENRKAELLSSPVEHIDITKFDARPVVDAWEKMSFTSRDAARAAETLAAAERFGGLEVSIAPLDVAPEGDLLVSTIPATAQTPDLVAGCARVPVLFEVLYDPWPTPLAASAGDRVLVRGLDLLVHQAALQFEQFTELPAPLLEMRQAGEAALRERLDEGT